MFKRVKISNDYFVYAAMLQRAITDHELEEVTLSNELQTKDILIKESMNAGDILLEDLHNNSKQLKSMPCSINWTKFKVTFYFHHFSFFSMNQIFIYMELNAY